MDSISSRELSEWMAFYNIEPFGDDIANFRQAMTTCMIANTHRDSKKKPTPFKIGDFMLGNNNIEKKPNMSADQIKAVMSGLRKG